MNKLIELYNLRSCGGSKMNKERAAKLLWPESKNPGVTMSRRIKSGHWTAKEINRLCEIFRVDPNFIFGYPSEVDKEFETPNNKS